MLGWEILLLYLALVAVCLWSLFGMVRVAQWWINKEEWEFTKWDKIWSFHTNIQFLVRFEAGQMTSMKAMWAFTISLASFLFSAIVLTMTILASSAGRNPFLP